MAIFKFESRRQDGKKTESSLVYIKDYPAAIVGIAIVAIALVVAAALFKTEIIGWFQAG